MSKKTARRLAQRLADAFCKGADPTADEWRALEVAARCRYDAWALTDLLRKWQIEEWEVGVRMWKRGNLERPYLDPDTVSQLRKLQQRGQSMIRHRSHDARDTRHRRREWNALSEEEQLLRVLAGKLPPPKR